MLIFSIESIENVCPMSTVQVDKHIKKRLFSYAAKLQEKSGRKVSLSEAIGKLLDSQEIEQTDRSKILSLYGILKDDGAQGRSDENIRLQGNLALDTSVLIEYLIASPLGESVRDYFENLKRDERAHCSLYTVSEVFYILCRRKGSRFASDKIGQMLASNVIVVHSSLELAMRAGNLKCAHAISLADCACLAVAESENCPAVFVSEEEFERQMSSIKKSFAEKILLLQRGTTK